MLRGVLEVVVPDEDGRGVEEGEDEGVLVGLEAVDEVDVDVGAVVLDEEVVCDELDVDEVVLDELEVEVADDTAVVVSNVDDDGGSMEVIEDIVVDREEREDESDESDVAGVGGDDINTPGMKSKKMENKKY